MSLIDINYSPDTMYGICSNQLVVGMSESRDEANSSIN